MWEMNQASGSQDGRWEDSKLFNIALKSLSGKRAYGRYTSDPGTLKTLMGDGTVLYAVASNPHLASEIDLLNDLIKVAVTDYFALTGLSTNLHLPADAFEALLATRNSSVRSEVAKSAPLSEEALMGLIRDESPEVREAVTRNPHLTAEMVAVLAKDEVSNVKRGAGSHPAAQVEVLKTLATSDDANARSGVARNPNLPQELIADLLDDEDSSVRLWAARNTSLAAAELIALSTGDDLTLRAAVGANTSTPQEVLGTLAGDANWRVRQSVARNPKTSAELLAKLSEDPNFLVRQEMASNPDLSLDIIHRLAGDRAWETRGLIAGNPLCPPEVLAALASDPYPDVPVEVLSNPNTPIDVFTQILQGLAEDTQAEDVSPDRKGTDSPDAGNSFVNKGSVVLWPELTPESQRAIVLANVDSLESVWREYFENWSIDESFEDHGPFEPLELAKVLDVPGAAELLGRVQEFDLSDGAEDSRESCELVVDDLVEWMTSYIPTIPAGFVVGWGFSLENNEENRQKLRLMNPHHIWSVVWGDVEYLTEGFVDSDDDFKVTRYFASDQPHISDASYVCDLALRVTCLLCDGEGYSPEGEACPACEDQGQTVVGVEHLAAQRAARLIPQSLRALTGWLK
jgi:hypothetical protein